MNAKRKRNVVAIETKLKAIQRIDDGDTVANIASDLGVGTSTVSDWKKNRKQIEEWCSIHPESSSSGNKSNKRKTMKSSEHEMVSEALYVWFCQKRNQGLPISENILREKALLFHARLKSPDDTVPEREQFTVSHSWLDRWKKRYGVRQLKIAGERLSAESHRVDLDEFKRHFHKMIDRKGLTAEQIFNCDETGLYYRMLPDKTLASREEKSAPGYKKSKERLTVMACSNVTADCKLPLVVIGKSKKPRAFKKLKDASTLPVFYRHQKSVWMNAAIFISWFETEFVPKVKEYLKSKDLKEEAVLLVDNAPSHPHSDILTKGKIKVLFFPPNVTSIGQPMDQGVLENLK